MISRGVIPTVSFFAGSVIVYQLLVRKFKFTRAEMIMAGMIICCAVLFGLTIIGLWFRGPGMQLTWL